MLRLGSNKGYAGFRSKAAVRCDNPKLSVPPRRINEIVHGKRSISAETAIRLARYFGSSEKFWLGLQEDFNLEEAGKRLGDRLDREVNIHAA
jgi:addiction module HigA family antidote